jgi:excisionase family DNA binding protein
LIRLTYVGTTRLLGRRTPRVDGDRRRIAKNLGAARPHAAVFAECETYERLRAVPAVPDELVEALAGRVADLLAERLPHRPEPWLDVDGAADYLACKPHRVYDLKAEGRLRFAKDGTRLLFRREWLDACLEEDDA